MAPQNMYNKPGFGLTQLLHAHDTGEGYQSYICILFGAPETRICRFHPLYLKSTCRNPVDWSVTRIYCMH